MSKIKLRDDQWQKVLLFLREHPRLYVGKEEKCRRFVEATLWMLRTGAQWRTLPIENGKWNSVYKRFARWCDAGVYDDLLDYFSDDADMESVMPDSTIVRAHPCAAGAKKKDDQAEQALGRSRGGFSTKLHIVVDALGNPLNILLTAGQRHDISQAEALLTDYIGDYVIADRGYDSDQFVEFILDQDATPVIPSRKNRRQPREYDKELYKERHLVECFINKLKHYRRTFSRFEKLASRFMGFVKFAATLIWLR